MFPVVNTDNFDDQILNAKGVVLVNVWAGWSEGCRQMSTTMGRLKNLLDEQDTIVQVDWDHQKILISELKVYGIPTLLIFVSGSEVARYSGVVNKEGLLTRIMEIKNNNQKKANVAH
jgi:thioredoxin 1